MQLDVVSLDAPSPAALPFEIVERKGLGHPDTICDALAENLSIALSHHYLERFGAILHHNVDKALLCGGASRPAFGGGEVLEPIEIYLAGRATAHFRGARIPVEEIAVETSRAWLKSHLRHLDVDRDVRIVPRIRATSSELATLFLERGAGGAARANDTSFGAGFAPLDALERTAFAVEQTLNASDFKAAHPWVGEDVKVMGLRHESRVSLTVACALVGKYVASLADYQSKKRDLASALVRVASAIAGTDVRVEVNAADGATRESVYLTVTGLSAEAGDDGQVGRGNRIDGLITPYRPMSLEAAAGKNPVSHVGKLYNVLAYRIARAIVKELPEVEQVDCYLLSQIGRAIDDPQMLDIRVRLSRSGELTRLRPRIAEIGRSHVASVSSLWRELIEGRLLSLWDGREEGTGRPVSS